MIRTTQNHFFMGSERNISRLTEERNRFMEQISTGKKFSRISEAPVEATQSLVYKTEDVRISQLGRNIVQGDNSLLVSETAADQANTVLVDSKRILTTWPGTHDTAMRKTMIEQMKQFEDRMYGLANTTENGSSIFAGFQRNADEAYSRISTPGSPLGALYNGDDGQLKMEIGAHHTLQTNVVGGGYTLDGRSYEGMFSIKKGADDEARDIFELFSRMIAGMEDGSIEKFRAASRYPLPDTGLRNLASGDLQLVNADGSTTPVPAAHTGATNGFEAAANNAWNINDAAAPAIVAQLRAEVTGSNPVPNFTTGDDLSLAAGDLKINGVEIGAVDFIEVPAETSQAAENAALRNIRSLAAAVNRKSDETGVWATYTPENDASYPYDYRLVLTRNEADGRAITIELANDAPGQTGLGTSTGTTDYYPGADGDGYNNAGGGTGSAVYNANNGAVTLRSDNAFRLRETATGALRETLGLRVNENLDEYQAENIMDRQITQLQKYLDHLTGTRASIAVRRDHLAAGEKDLKDRAMSLEDAVDQLEKVDMEEAIMKYYAAQNYYEATLASTSRVITTSILNYLR